MSIDKTWNTLQSTVKVIEIISFKLWQMQEYSLLYPALAN